MMSANDMVIRNRGSSFKDKFSWKREKRTSSLKYKSPRQDGSKPLFSSSSTPNLWGTGTSMGSIFNLFNDGVVKIHQVLDAPTSNILVKFLQYTRALKTWETHHLYLNDNNITSDTPTGIFSTPLEYSSIAQVIGLELKREPVNYCVKICTSSMSILLHAANVHQRDRWQNSIQWKLDVWKSRMVLASAAQPEALLRELKSLVKLTLDCPLDVDDTHRVILDVVSVLLVQKSELIKNLSHEAFITALAPLLERNQPSVEICLFFTKHCRQCPRSIVVIDMFTPIVQRILKHNVDFGKYTCLRTFVAEYIQALSSQNNGKEQVQNFVHVMHGPMSQCPHPRVLNNLVAVCLASIYQCFSSDKSTERTNKGRKSRPGALFSSKCLKPNNQILNNSCNNEPEILKNCNLDNLEHDQKLKTINEDTKLLNTDIAKRNIDDPNLVESYSRAEKRLSIISTDPNQLYSLNDDQLQTVSLFVGIFMEISRLPDWCLGLASLLQPLPFPEEAMTNIQFTRLMYPVIKQFVEDGRDSVIKCLLYSRDNRDGWLHVYSPGGFACEDDGKLFTRMMEELLKPGVQIGRMKKFMSTLAGTHLEVIIMLAVRENSVMIQLLRDMLKTGVLTDEQEQLQAISALRCTATGKEVYSELKSLYSALTRNGGLKQYYPPPNFTDDDLQKLFSTGVWGNLEILDLSYTNVTSRSADVLANLPNLRHLNLWSTKFDDHGLCVLCDSLDLRYLNLCETNVTDEGIQCLEAMQNLEYLNLNSTKLSAATFFNLKRKLSKLASYDITYTDADV